MQLPFHSIADDYHQRLIVHRAVTQAREQARSAFLFGMDADGLDAEGVSILADEAWRIYQARITFDYPLYARTLFLHAYRTAYRVYIQGLAHGHAVDATLLTSDILAANERHHPPASAS